MTDNEQILAEVRKISAWFDLQRKMTKWSLILFAVIIPTLVVSVVVTERQYSDSEETADWYVVDNSLRRGDFDDAIRIGEKLTLKTPHYPDGHRRLGGAYLALGNIEKAREHYAEAFRLFPSEENEKLLAALDKRSTSESQPGGAGSGRPPIRLETNSTSSGTGAPR